MRIPLLAAVLALASCSWISFGRRQSDDELRLMSEVKSFYKELPRDGCLRRRVAFDELGYSRAVTRVACELPGGGKREERHTLERSRGRWRLVSREKH